MYALSLLFHLIYNIIHFYVVVWAEKFGEICKNVSPDVISHCKTCLKRHSEFNKGLGLYFLVIFSFCQIIMIVNLFSVISFGIMEDIFVDSWERPFMSLSFLFYALNFTGVILSITLTSEKSFNELKRLSVTLREFKGRLDWHENEKKLPSSLFTAHYPEQTITEVTEDIKEAAPLSGKGFFMVTRTNLTGMMGISLTYLIILLQFRVA